LGAFRDGVVGNLLVLNPIGLAAIRRTIEVGKGFDPDDRPAPVGKTAVVLGGVPIGGTRLDREGERLARELAVSPALAGCDLEPMKAGGEFNPSMQHDQQLH
jgi:hypothetical protein